MAYTTHITTAFEMQRATIEQSQRAFEQTLDFQQTVNEAVVNGFDSQESAQRRGVELSQTVLHSYLDIVESSVPGAAGSVDEVRAAVDEQFDFLLENHAEVFETVAAEYEQGIDAYDELTADYVEAVDEQVEMLVEAHEELESQSVDVAEQWGEQLGDLQEQVTDVQEQAAAAVDA
ncbi:hypothetical protein BRD06_04205 [Halobacteriales archaeon QS_9_67_15]|nr:MAG: hypothetical protein BRD06_04205 [Halobacteriales archaeon QS_9_67_15]